MKTIDMTPKWVELLPAFIAMLESGTPESRGYAMRELSRALQALDEFIEREKAAQEIDND